MKDAEIEQAWKLIYPNQVFLVISADKDGKPNVMTAGWAMHTSFSPPLVAISIGKTRYTHELISGSKEFVLAMPNKDMGKQVLYCGSHSGRDVDKIKDSGLQTAKAKFVKPPLIKGAVVNFECKVTKNIETGDHIIFVGEILAAYSEPGKILLDFGSGKFGSI